jgi:pyruvate formate-lyase activating enzyme-like uncharacterized protein
MDEREAESLAVGQMLDIDIGIETPVIRGVRRACCPIILKTAVEEMKFAGKSGRLRDQR